MAAVQTAQVSSPHGSRRSDFRVLDNRLDVPRDDVPPEPSVGEHLEIAAHRDPEVFAACNAKGL